MDNGQLNNLARDFFEKKAKLDSINEVVKEAKAEKAEAEDLLCNAMTAGAMSKMSLEGMGTFSIRKSTNWNIVDQQQIVAYLKDHAPEMIKIHPQSIKGWANDFRLGKDDASVMNEDDWITFFGMKPYDKVGITLRKV